MCFDNIGPSMLCAEQPGPSRRFKGVDEEFSKHFINNPFGSVCGICDRLWFKSDLRPCVPSYISLLATVFGADEYSSASNMEGVCSTCVASLKQGNVPPLCKSYGFQYPPIPPNLPPLNPVEERLICPRLPFMQIRRLRYVDGMYGIVGQVINVPVKVDNMVNVLPRTLEDDYAINVNIKRQIIHKSSYLSGTVRKSVLTPWLKYLVETPLYKRYNVTANLQLVDGIASFGQPRASTSKAPDDEDESYVEDPPLLDCEEGVARQHTLMWDESKVLNIAPGERERPLSLLYDVHAEELSFPTIYYGQPRTFPFSSAKVTPYMMTTSELRRSDRRGVSPHHVLYMGMKIMRMRVADGMYKTFRQSVISSITRAQVEDQQYVTSMAENNFAMFRSVPNSMTYWAEKKHELFAMIRQLGKPTFFLTMSANEVNWPVLLRVLQRYGDPNSTQDISSMTRVLKNKLVSEDPVMCCILFNRLVDVIMNILCSKRPGRNPLHPHRVVNYYKRIEFQHRGSPHAHILLWLDNVPDEAVTEAMPASCAMVDRLSTVSRSDVPADVYSGQIHRHTFTCTKRGENQCRFGIPYWPLRETAVLVPLPTDDSRRPPLRKRATELRKNLETKVYDGIDEFLVDHSLSYEQYLNVIRSYIKRPMMLFKRNMSEIYTNTFNPWVARVLGSNTDLQFILDEYSCAAYVVEYVNKSNRGISNLQRELAALRDKYPESDSSDLMKKLGVQLLNNVELSSQEAAWYLLRQPMSKSTRKVTFIPTVWPSERQRAHKQRKQMDEEGLDADSTDIWTLSVIEKYEQRPRELEAVTLAEFVAWYYKSSKKSKPAEDIDAAPAASDSEDDNGEATSDLPIVAGYKLRKEKIVIRYRSYDMDSDVKNYKREMVLLYVPFRNETTELLDRELYMQLYDQHQESILLKRKMFEYRLDIARVMERLAAMYVEEQDAREPSAPFDPLAPERIMQNNDDDIELRDTESRPVVAVSKRSDILTSQQYCEAVRATNARQRELILECIHRLHTPGSDPIQIFFTGPAGSGKTFVLKLLMETYNRHYKEGEGANNAYVACASTGKAASQIDGTTVHAAFSLALQKQRNDGDGRLKLNRLYDYKRSFCKVKAIIIDEVSMVGHNLLNLVNARLAEITDECDIPFGGFDLVCCGDFRQLEPVMASPVYRAPRSALVGPVLWHGLSYYPLTDVMRQSDVVFSDILNSIGNGLKLTEQQIAVVESRFRNRNWCKENLPGVIRLYHGNINVDAYNSEAVSDEICSIAQDEFTGYSGKQQLTTVRTKLHKLPATNTAGLPYRLNLEVGKPYMITANVDTLDKLTNGTIGVLKHVETDIVDSDKITRLWFDFTSEGKSVGAAARVKVVPAVVSSGGVLHRTWTPIEKRSGTINLDGHVRCRRINFPCVPSCAITIHKSQGATFDSVAIEYTKKMSQQLLYVAMSRCRSLEGLYIIADEVKFYHGSGCNSPTMRDIRNEYKRLENHPLPTVSDSVRQFIAEAKLAARLLVTNLNVQSIVAHRLDIESDSLLPNCDYFVASETWMAEDRPVQLNNFVLVAQENTAMPRHSKKTKRKASGVAIYRSVESTSTCNPLTIQPPDKTRDIAGDITAVEITYQNMYKFVLVGVYIHPGSPDTEVLYLIHRGLGRYGKSISKVIPKMIADMTTPIMLCGDFNKHAPDHENLLQDINDEYGLQLHSLPSTTLGNTSIDLTFSRNMQLFAQIFVSYFSYHRSIFHQLALGDSVNSE